LRDDAHLLAIELDNVGRVEPGGECPLIDMREPQIRIEDLEHPRRGREQTAECGARSFVPLGQRPETEDVSYRSVIGSLDRIPCRRFVNIEGVRLSVDFNPDLPGWEGVVPLQQRCIHSSAKELVEDAPAVGIPAEAAHESDVPPPSRQVRRQVERRPGHDSFVGEGIN
jgi:hypothetical protein